MPRQPTREPIDTPADPDQPEPARPPGRDPIDPPVEEPKDPDPLKIEDPPLPGFEDPPAPAKSQRAHAGEIAAFTSAYLALTGVLILL